MSEMTNEQYELQALREFYQMMIEYGVIPDLQAQLFQDDRESHSELEDILQSISALSDGYFHDNESEQS
jgi:hypothetical protein